MAKIKKVPGTGILKYGHGPWKGTITDYFRFGTDQETEVLLADFRDSLVNGKLGEEFYFAGRKTSKWNYFNDKTQDYIEQVIEREGDKEVAYNLLVKEIVDMIDGVPLKDGEDRPQKMPYVSYGSGLNQTNVVILKDDECLGTDGRYLKIAIDSERRWIIVFHPNNGKR